MGGSPALEERLDAVHLYLVTPAQPKAGPLDKFLPRVLEAGVGAVQLREKQMEAAPLLGFAEVVRRRTEEFGALFILNDRVDVTIAAGADGVHLGRDDLPVDFARRLLGPDALIGLSTHSEEQVLAASLLDVSYIGVGPVHATPTKPGRPPVGYGLVELASRRSGHPFFAIGGIDLDTIEAVIDAGATRVSVLRALTEADDPASVAREISDRLARAGEAPPEAGGIRPAR